MTRMRLRSCGQMLSKKKKSSFHFARLAFMQPLPEFAAPKRDYGKTMFLYSQIPLLPENWLTVMTSVKRAAFG